jgi:hypothetical protein
MRERPESIRRRPCKLRGLASGALTGTSPFLQQIASTLAAETSPRGFFFCTLRGRLRGCAYGWYNDHTGTIVRRLRSLGCSQWSSVPVSGGLAYYWLRTAKMQRAACEAALPLSPRGAILLRVSLHRSKHPGHDGCALGTYDNETLDHLLSVADVGPV